MCVIVLTIVLLSINFCNAFSYIFGLKNLCDFILSQRKFPLVVVDVGKICPQDPVSVRTWT